MFFKYIVFYFINSPIIMKNKTRKTRKTQKVNIRYLPYRLTKKDREKQIGMLKKSQKMYKNIDIIRGKNYHLINPKIKTYFEGRKNVRSRNHPTEQGIGGKNKMFRGCFRKNSE